MKIGNIIRIKKNICDMNFYNPYMEPYCGKVATITQYIDGGFIKLDIDDEQWWWTEEMVEHIEDTNTKDTLGSKMRNHLSPFYNALCAITHCKQNVKDCGITKDMLLEYLFNSYEDMFNSYKELIIMSYNPIVDETEVID